MRTVMVCVDSRATWSRALTVCEAIQGRQDLQLHLVLMGPAADATAKQCGIRAEKWLYDGFQPYDLMVSMGPQQYESMAYLFSFYLDRLSSEIIPAVKPDVVISVTDRYESLAVAVAAALSNVHLAHIQGGEVSGGIDESMRHAITKLAHIHFPANQASAERIIKMGEDPAFVFNVGCPATDLLLRVDLGTDDGRPNILICYNPVTTQGPKENQQEMGAILDAVQGFPVTTLGRIIGPNHDPGSEAVWAAITERGLGADASVGHSEFIRAIAHASVMVGNSSAGIREACYFGTPVVDVGIRQHLRTASRNVLTVYKPEREAIQAAIAAQLKHGRYPPEQPFGNGGAGKKIAELLATMELPPIQKRIRY